jgi:hypothetical protein
MDVIDLTPAVNGFAQILGARDHISLLRLHLDGRPASASDARVYYAIAEHDHLVFASKDAGATSEEFEKLTRGKADTLSNGHESSGNQYFLDTQPSSLPTMRGEMFHKLAMQLSTQLRTTDVPLADGRA